MTGLQESNNPNCLQNNTAPYDYHLKFLLVGDSDVGKAEILNYLEGYYENNLLGVYSKTSLFYLENKRIKLQLWDTSGQGRFCTIIRSYSRGAHGVLMVYDITNKWSFKGIDRWLKELDNHIPGIPKILIGNRLHLEYKREVSLEQAEQYAAKYNMEFFEVSPLCSFNVNEAIIELVALALHRIGMEKIWTSRDVSTLQELCCESLLTSVKFFDINRLCLPNSVKSQLKTYFMMHHKKKNELRFPKGCLRPSSKANPQTSTTNSFSAGSGSCSGFGSLCSKNRTLSHTNPKTPKSGDKSDTCSFRRYKLPQISKLTLLAHSAGKCFRLRRPPSINATNTNKQLPSRTLL